MIERRVHTQALDLRQQVEGPEPLRTLVGYAAVFGSETQIGNDFREVVEPGAFDAALARPDDVRALLNHDASRVLGRLSAGTLRLSVDAQGLRYEVDLPETSYARDLAASVARGDISQSSFGFRVVSDEWERPESRGDLPLRRIRNLELFDVSPVTFPAYDATSVSTRARDLAQQCRTQMDPLTAQAAEWERMRHLSL
jgi:uncharacterized protein